MSFYPREYNDKAIAAMNKNFVPVKKRVVRVKAKFIEFCKRLDLCRLATDITNNRGNS